jgi:hypothetical protein
MMIAVTIRDARRNDKYCCALQYEQELDMNPMLIPLMMYRGWLQMLFPKVDVPKVEEARYEG